DGGLFGTSVWGDGGFTVSWDITESSGTWTYTYNLTVASRGISHAIFEVTEDDNDFNMFGGSSGFGSEGSFSIADGNSNPLMPNAMFGVKYDVTDGDDGENLLLTIVTD